MNAGATFAQQYGLRPGVALSAAQMAQLTSDIVWLVEQTVTLPDGSSQWVLVPQVYVRVRQGDIDGSGALRCARAPASTVCFDPRPGYGDDDAQYLALMTAGVSFTDPYGLRPGLSGRPPARLASPVPGPTPKV